MLGCAATARNAQVDVLSLLEGDFRESMLKGNTLFRSGAYEEALPELLDYWQSNRDDFNVTFAIAQCYSQIGKAELAGKFLVETIKHYAFELSTEQLETAFSNVYEDDVFAGYLAQVKEHNESLQNNRGTVGYITAPTKLRYRTVLPQNYDPLNEYIVLIFMHGHGGSMLNFASYSPILQENNIIFIQPQGPYPWEMALGRSASFSWGVMDIDESEDYESGNFSWALTTDFIMQLNKELREKYNVKSLYLSGFSQGGGQSLSIGLRNQDAFDGLVCFGGALWAFDDDELLPPNEGVSVLIVHGETDMVVSFDSGVDAYNRLKEQDYDVHLQTFDGAHTIPREVFIKSIEWILEN